MPSSPMNSITKTFSLKAIGNGTLAPALFASSKFLNSFFVQAKTTSRLFFQISLKRTSPSRYRFMFLKSLVSIL
jgi:hypothetical protein